MRYFLKKKPNVLNLRLYGSKVFVRKPEQKRHSKWDKKAEMGILIGYSEVGYRVLLNNKVIVSRHVDIVEEEKCIGLNGEESDVESNECDENSDSDVSLENKEEIVNFLNENKDNLSRPKRQRKPPERFAECYKNSIFANYSRADIPVSFEEAINSNDRKNWINAMDNEINILNKNET